ncbi:hypothetical protein KY289_020029 [Solanum tuberosum]|nr:hypothetical protein KY289_020029 [Solanum tuberosum]
MSEESQRILGKSNAVGIGSDNITSTNSGGLTDSMAFFSNGKVHMPNNGSTSPGFNPPSGVSTGTGQYLHHQQNFYGSILGSTPDSNSSTPMISSGGSHALMANLQPSHLQQPHPHFSPQHSTMHTDDKWIIDSGASKYMVHNLGMLTQHTSLDDSPIHRVHLPSGSSAHVSNIGSSQADCQLKSQGAQLKSPKTQVHVVNVASFTMSYDTSSPLVVPPIVSPNSAPPDSEGLDNIASDVSSSSGVLPPPTTIESPVLRRSSRPTKPLIWMHDFLTNQPKSKCLYSVFEHVTYANISPTYGVALTAYSSTLEPTSFAEAAS